MDEWAFETAEICLEAFVLAVDDNVRPTRLDSTHTVMKMGNTTLKR